jgi:hypothetical protein
VSTVLWDEEPSDGCEECRHTSFIGILVQNTKHKPADRCSVSPIVFMDHLTICQEIKNGPVTSSTAPPSGIRMEPLVFGCNLSKDTDLVVCVHLDNPAPARTIDIIPKATSAFKLSSAYGPFVVAGCCCSKCTAQVRRTVRSSQQHE